MSDNFMEQLRAFTGNVYLKAQFVRSLTTREHGADEVFVKHCTTVAEMGMFAGEEVPNCCRGSAVHNVLKSYAFFEMLAGPKCRGGSGSHKWQHGNRGACKLLRRDRNSRCITET